MMLHVPLCSQRQASERVSSLEAELLSIAKDDIVQSNPLMKEQVLSQPHSSCPNPHFS